MKVLLDIKDDKAEIFLDMLKGLKFVKSTRLTEPNARFLADLKEASPPISNEALYLTISHQSACNTGALRGRIARAVLELSREGKMDGLIAAAIKEWQAQ